MLIKNAKITYNGFKDEWSVIKCVVENAIIENY
jgi:hypothetical protein